MADRSKQTCAARKDINSAEKAKVMITLGSVRVGHIVRRSPLRAQSNSVDRKRGNGGDADTASHYSARACGFLFAAHMQWTAVMLSRKIELSIQLQ
jgi:hypothetical protein